MSLLGCEGSSVCVCVCVCVCGGSVVGFVMWCCGASVVECECVLWCECCEVEVW